MVQHTDAKITALALSAVIILISIFLPAREMHACGGQWFRPLMHTSWLHASLNAWCLISIVFIYDVSLPLLMTAYAVSISFTMYIMPYPPTVGLSGICFFLMGAILFKVRRKLYYQACIAAYIAIGCCFPVVNGWIHLYCYCVGLFVAVLTKRKR